MVQSFIYLIFLRLLSEHYAKGFDVLLFVYFVGAESEYSFDNNEEGQWSLTTMNQSFRQVWFTNSTVAMFRNMITLDYMPNQVCTQTIPSDAR